MRKLKATWTIEAQQDLRGWFNSQAAEEFRIRMAEEFSATFSKIIDIEKTNLEKIDWINEGF